MRVLILGSGGQLGWELQRTRPAAWEVTALTRAECDVRAEPEVRRAVVAAAPDLIINAAAYTAVDKAETEKEAAFAVNALGAAHVARAARERGLRLVHLSTDFVFDGLGSRPYRPGDPENPLGVYGASKLEGEREVLRIGDRGAVVLRTAWLYSSHGANFVKTMLRLMRERNELRVVADQVGTPTWARGLADAIWEIAARPDVAGLCHWTDAGVASWYDFAVAIQEEAVAIGLLPKAAAILPITTEEFPTPARRPAYSVLDKSLLWRLLGTTAPHWRVSLRAMLQELKVNE